MATEQSVVNGNRLPEAMVRLLSSGRLNELPAETITKALDLEEMTRPRFFGFDYVAGKLASEWLNVPEEFRGTRSREFDPGHIDVHQSVVIGDADSDMPIALDFRVQDGPSVVVLHWTEHGSSWRKVADDVAEFVAKLGLLL